jgi:SAM-dependent methyltransferase
MVRVPGSTGYESNATVLARLYESVSFEDVHGGVLHLLPSHPSHVLDVGAGTGRDAAALAIRGHHVVAVEPTAELRDIGLRLHGTLPIDWVDDHLPQLEVILRRGKRFDLIVLSAVWMHLDEAERRIAMRTVAELLAPSGQILLTLRHGAIPEGRRMFEVSAIETVRLGEAYDLRPNHHAERMGRFNRGDVTWTVLGLKRALPRSA